MTTLRGMAKPNMVMRSLRVPEKLWEAAKAKADESRGEHQRRDPRGAGAVRQADAISTRDVAVCESGAEVHPGDDGPCAEASEEGALGVAGHGRASSRTPW